MAKATWPPRRPSHPLLTDIGRFLDVASRIVGALGAFCDATHLREIERFFSAHSVPAAERPLRQSVERIEDCIALREAQRPQLEAWLTGTAAHRR